MNSKIYTGIGARDTPEKVMAAMRNIATILARKKYILRSGGAVGADTAFEDFAGDSKEIYLPYKNFNGNKSHLYPATPEAYEMAAKYHPKWKSLKSSHKDFHARNMHQVLGRDLTTPTEFIICWTSDGKASGGTGQALRLAKSQDIMIYNLFNEVDQIRLHQFLEDLIK